MKNSRKITWKTFYTWVLITSHTWRSFFIIQFNIIRISIAQPGSQSPKDVKELLDIFTFNFTPTNLEISSEWRGGLPICYQFISATFLADLNRHNFCSRLPHTPSSQFRTKFAESRTSVNLPRGWILFTGIWRRFASHKLNSHLFMLVTEKGHEFTYMRCFIRHHTFRTYSPAIRINENCSPNFDLEGVHSTKRFSSFKSVLGKQKLLINSPSLV